MRVNVGRTKKPGLTADERRAIAQALGRMGGLRGGPARAEALTPAERRAMSNRANSAKGMPNRRIAELPIRIVTRGAAKVCAYCGLQINYGVPYRDGISRRFHTRDPDTQDPPCDQRAAKAAGEPMKPRARRFVRKGKRAA